MLLEIDRISRRYSARVWGLRDLSLRLGPGLHGLLGPNGAGKSTLMRILATLDRPTEGEVRWNGGDITEDPDALRRELGYLPQDFGVYPQLDAVEFLHYIAAAKGLTRQVAAARIEQLLIQLNLAGVARRRLATFSGGMKQRVGVAQALLNDPRLLIADEPTTGLDPEERASLRELLRQLAGERVVLLSTHIVPDVAAIAGTIAVMAAGCLIVHASPAELLRSTGTSSLEDAYLRLQTDRRSRVA